MNRWIATPEIPPDHRGPADRPFVRFTDDGLGRPILEHLSAAARRDPERVVIEDAEGPLSFAAFLEAIGRTAASVPPGAGPVAVLAQAGRDYAVAAFATLAAGRIGLLLDPEHPAARNGAIAAHAGATQSVVAVAGPGPAAAMALPALQQDAPAFILCTSGSTGAPKAIVHSQRTMLHWVRSITNALHVTAADRVLSVSSMASLGGVTALLTFPLAGASLQIVSLRGGLGGIVEALLTRPVTVLRAGPSLLRTMVRLPGIGDALRRLRAVQFYGEPLLQADLDLLRPFLAPDCLIRSTYGATEASGFAWFAGPDERHDPVRVATGTLMPDTEARIECEDGTQCGPGAAGELVIRSRYNALGEWADGAVTPGRLVPDVDDPAARVFRTGDLARAGSDGVFVVLGRLDRMVNINGQRAEPAEVEAALRRNPHVAAAAAVVRQMGPRTLLVAFVVPQPDAPAGLVDVLRAELVGLLPAFLQPSRILTVPALPLLPGGKLDHAALSALVD